MSPLFQYLEQEVISDIARRISKTMKYTRTAENMAVSMYRKGYSPAYIRKEAMKKLNADKDFRKEVAKNTVEYKKEISKLIQKIENDAYKAGDKILAAAGDMAWYDDLAVWKQAGKLLTTSASTLSMLVDGIKKQTKGEMKNLTRTLGFKTKSGFTSVGNAYRNELDKAMIKLISGTFSQEQVFNDTVRNLAQSGIKTVTYGNRAENLDVAVSRALRTGAHQIAGEIQNNNIKEMGENLVYVQEHAGARNTGVGVANHEEWQGKVYYIKPGTDYSEEAKRVGQQNIEDLWECTGYSVDNMHINDPAGLFGYNCRHLYNVWFEGISSLPAKQPVKPPVVWNGKVLDFYTQTQEARKQERNIRALKRERDALERTGQDTTEIKKKLSEAGRKYKQFCKVCKFPPNTTRTRYESGTADLTKTKAYREYKNVSKGLGANDNDDIVVEHKEAELIDNIDISNEEMVKSYLREFEKSAVNEKIETACVITTDGTVYKCYGIKDRVFPDSDLGDKLIGAFVTHNHPISETSYTFSPDDIALFMNYNLGTLRGCDEKYVYELTRNASEIDETPSDWRSIESYEHGNVIEIAKKLGIGYRRCKNE